MVKLKFFLIYLGAKAIFCRLE
jgi:hypothetical protein